MALRKQNDPKSNKKRFKSTTSKNKESKNKEVRIPRPLGLTLLAQQTRNQDTTNEVISRILNYSFSNNLQLNNKKITIKSLSIYLNISYIKVMKAYLEYQNKMSKMILGKGEDMLGALTFLGFSEILEDKASVNQQLQLLQASQGNGYRAYISSSVNEALGLKMKSTDAILGLMKLLIPKSNTLIQNNFPSQQGKEVGAIKAIGMAEALHILEQKNMLQISYNPDTYSDLSNEHSIEEGPEVRANFQAKVLTDGASLLSSPNAHINRRAKEEGLDIEDHI